MKLQESHTIGLLSIQIEKYDNIKDWKYWVDLLTGNQGGQIIGRLLRVTSFINAHSPEPDPLAAPSPSSPESSLAVLLMASAEPPPLMKANGGYVKKIHSSST